MTTTSENSSYFSRASVLNLATSKATTPAHVVDFDDGHIPENTAGVATKLVKYRELIVVETKAWEASGE